MRSGAREAPAQGSGTVGLQLGADLLQLRSVSLSSSQWPVTRLLR